MFTLFIAGLTSRSKNDISRVRRMCESHFGDYYELEIVNVLKDPQRAVAERIYATPTLVKNLPLPCCRILGDLSDMEKVFSSLDL